MTTTRHHQLSRCEDLDGGAAEIRRGGGEKNAGSVERSWSRRGFGCSPFRWVRLANGSLARHAQHPKLVTAFSAMLAGSRAGVS